MKIKLPRRLGAVLLGAAMLLAACGSGSEPAAPTESDAAVESDESAETQPETQPEETEQSDDSAEIEEEPEVVGGYPVVLDRIDGSTLTIPAKPERIVSLSASSTEMLFAIGAGDQVVAVDSFSNFPAEAPITDLSAFEPNFEAITTFEPDLVIVSFDAENALANAFDALGVPVLVQGSAFTVDDTYAQIADLGVITDRVDEAAAVNAEIQSRIAAATASAAAAEGDPVKVYHELDDTFYSASSASFIGDLYTRMGFENVADAADPDGIGFPQVTQEFLIEADPDLIVITDQVGYTADDVAARPGWDSISAVKNNNVVMLDADVASRWGPRVADLAERLAELRAPVSTG